MPAAFALLVRGQQSIFLLMVWCDEKAEYVRRQIGLSDSSYPPQRRWRAASTTLALAIGALTVGAAASASAAPLPVTGPAAGGTAVSDSVPLLTFTSVHAGGESGFAVGSDTVSYGWGYNLYGQVGDGTTIDRLTPVKVQLPVGVTFESLSGWGNSTYSLGSDGNAYAWGENNYGQLGDGTTQSKSVPTLVQTPTGVAFTALSSTYTSAFAIGTNGNVYAWGRNDLGQLGDGTTTDHSVPVQVATPAGVTFTAISGGGATVYAIGSDNNVYAWGRNGSGQVGDGTTIDRTVPTIVQQPTGVVFVSVNGGGAFANATGADGNIYGWGANGYGQLGDGTGIDRLAPVQTLVPAGITFPTLSAGQFSGYAIGSDTKAYSWGGNYASQLGDGTTTDRSTPGLISTPTGVSFSAISSANDNAYAIGSDGIAYAWGYNFSGQLGDGTLENQPVPVPIAVNEQPVVTEVRFGGVAGTGLSQVGSTWTAITPAGCGVVDVAVDYTARGATQTITTPAGFSYGTAPAISTQPASLAVTVGQTATLTVAGTGDPVPTVQWQLRDQTGHWADVPGATATSYAAPTSAAGILDYRAVFSSCDVSLTSEIATVTVASSATTPPPASGTPVAGNAGSLANTGAELPWLPLVLGGALTAAGIIVAVLRRSKLS